MARVKKMHWRRFVLKKRKINLKKKLWGLFSRYVRRSHADENGMVKCFSCDSVHHWKEMDAGHYHAGSTSLALFFDERNVKPQCTACNRFRHGNLTQYAIALQKLYGMDILDTLDGARHTIDKISNSTYEALIEKYEEKLDQCV
jgi:hypothetical protein